MRSLFIAVIVVMAAGLAWWLKFDHHAPTAQLASAVTTIGRSTPIDIDVRSGPTGLRAAVVRLQTGGNVYELLKESYPATSWRGSDVVEKRLHLELDLTQLQVPEGPATLEVFVDTHAWHVLSPSHAPALSAALTVDLTPPRLELLSTQHNARLGGVELAVFRVSPDTVSSGIVVESYFFPTAVGYFADHDIGLAFFAIPQDLSANVRPHLIARDAAGNERSVYLPCTIKPRQFAERTLAVTDDFLASKVRDIEHDSHLVPASDLLHGYLFINSELRKRNEAQISEVTRNSSPQPLWDGVFVRQANAAPLSSFADRRTYTYNGAVVDHQTHLGFDLASLKLSPVGAAQNGIVVFAGDLGIYGNTVIVDHGLGIFSLYGHLSTIAVQTGERVRPAQPLGQTGDTGLAAGDHLHFSILLHGIHVDPVEWWDPHWLRDHVISKLDMFPKATTASRPAGAHEQDRS